MNEREKDVLKCRFVAEDSTLTRDNLYGGGAGQLRKVADSTKSESDQEVYELLANVSFSGGVQLVGDTYQLAISIRLTIVPGHYVTRVCRFRFPDIPEHKWMMEYIDASDTLLTQDDLARFGITVKVKQYAVGDVLAESRVQLIQSGQGETETMSVSEGAHWQNSHSHDATAESYALIEGTIIIVSETASSRELAVEAFTKTETGFKSVSFSYDPKSGRQWDITHHEFDGPVSPIIQTKTSVPHNVFLAGGTVIATSKVVFDVDQAHTSGTDWNKEEALDDTLNSVVEDSEGNYGVTQIEIVDLVQQAFRA